MNHPIEIGRTHSLPVVTLVPGGVRLDANGLELFLPAHLAPDDVGPGDPIEVFIYCDHQGAPQATTWVPAAELDQCAFLKCVAITRAGAFLDWGVPKDLYAPPDEQKVPMVEGRRYVVMVCLDRKQERLIASSQLPQRLDRNVEHFALDEAVDLLVYGQIDAGPQVVVNHRYQGLIHRSELSGRLATGTKARGYIRQVREDQRLDIGLTRRGLGGILDAKDTILRALEQAGGSLPLHDRSSPEQIQRLLGISKKAFKRGTGGLYKARKIVINDDGITLVDPS